MSEKLGIDTFALKTVLDNLSTLVLVTNSNAEIIYANGGVSKFLDTADTSIINSKLGHAFKCLYDEQFGCGNSEYCQNMCDMRKTLLNAMKTKTVQTCEKALIHLSSGSNLVLKIKAIPYSFENGDFVIFLCEDFEEHAAYEMAKEKAAKIMALKETGGAIAHELNNPLAIALAQCSFALRDKNLTDPKLKEKIEKINLQLEKMVAIVRQIDEIVDYKIKAFGQGVSIADLENKKQGPIK